MHVSSLQGQLDNLKADTSKECHVYPSTELDLSHGRDRFTPMPAPNLPGLRSSQRHFFEANMPRFHGLTSSAYGFDVARSSLKIMGIDQEAGPGENPVLEDTTHVSAPMGADKAFSPHIVKDPIWSIGQTQAIRLARLYEEECGLMYPMFDIEDIIQNIRLLYTYMEASLQAYFTRLSGVQAIGNEDKNIAKMVVAVGLVLEENGHSTVAQEIYGSLMPTMSAIITGATNMKGIILLILFVSVFVRSNA